MLGKGTLITLMILSSGLVEHFVIWKEDTTEGTELSPISQKKPQKQTKTPNLARNKSRIISSHQWPQLDL